MPAETGLTTPTFYRFYRVCNGFSTGLVRRGASPTLDLDTRLEDRTRALLAGYQMHLAKPAKPTGLVVTIASLTGQV